MTQTKKIENGKDEWEKEFDDRNLGCCGGDSCPNYIAMYDDNGEQLISGHNRVLKDFIRSLLSTKDKKEE